MSDHAKDCAEYIVYQWLTMPEYVRHRDANPQLGFSQARVLAVAELIQNAMNEANTEIVTWLADAARKNNELQCEVDRLRRELEKRRSEREED